MKGHHDESKLAVQTPPQELHSQHFESDAVLDNSAENLDGIEARSAGPSVKRCLSRHSSEGAVSEGGDSLDSLSLQDFQGSVSEEEKKEEGAASGEEKEYTIRDALAMMEKKQQGHHGRNASKHGQRMDSMETQTDRDLISRQSIGRRIKMNRQSIN